VVVDNINLTKQRVPPKKIYGERFQFSVCGFNYALLAGLDSWTLYLEGILVDVVDL
jgi:hypothetical protein